MVSPPSAWPSRAESPSSRTSAASSWGLWLASRQSTAPWSRVGGAAWDNPAMDEDLVEMQVESVRVHMLSNRHVVILKEADRDRYLPIWIGPWEASSIAM